MKASLTPRHIGSVPLEMNPRCFVCHYYAWPSYLEALREWGRWCGSVNCHRVIPVFPALCHPPHSVILVSEPGVSPGFRGADCLCGGLWVAAFPSGSICQHIPISCFLEFVEISCPFDVVFQQTVFNPLEFFCFVFWRFLFFRNSGGATRLSTILKLKSYQVVYLKKKIAFGFWLLFYFLKWEIYHTYTHTYKRVYISVCII